MQGEGRAETWRKVMESAAWAEILFILNRGRSEKYADQA